MNQNLKVTLIVGSIVVVGLFALYVFADNFLPLGSQRYTEFYEFHINEMELIKAIGKFKVENPKYSFQATELLPTAKKVQVPYLERDTNLHVYYLHLYNYVEKQIVCFYIRHQDRSSCKLGFVSINRWLPFADWKRVNKDLAGEENREAKREFEEDILDKLDIKYEKEGNSAPIFHDLYDKIFRRRNY